MKTHENGIERETSGDRKDSKTLIRNVAASDDLESVTSYFMTSLDNMSTVQAIPI